MCKIATYIKMEAPKYRLAAKIVAIFDCLLTGLPLFLCLFVLLMSGTAAAKGDKIDGIGIFIQVLFTAVFTIFFGFAVGLLRSTQSDDGHPTAVTAWIVFKILVFVIITVGIFGAMEHSSGFTDYHLWLLVAGVINGVPLYIVVNYRNELS